MKEKKCLELGIKSSLIKLDESISESELIYQICNLNNDKSIHGILVQLPLPSTYK